MDKFYFNSEIKVEETDDKPTKLVGYAMKWNVLSHNLGGEFATIFQVFKEGCFGDPIETYEGLDHKAYYEHQNLSYLARTKNNSLRLSLDEIGLRFEIDLPDTTLGNDIKALVARGDLSDCSFGYVSEESEWDEETRTVTHIKGKLMEISVVHDPAFPETELQLASRKKQEQERKQQEEMPVETFNRNRAKRILQMKGEKFFS